MKIRCSVVALLSGLAISSAHAQTSIGWLNTSGGFWNAAANWADGNIPDNSGERAVISLAGLYNVQINAAYTINGIDNQNPSANVQLLNNVSLDLSGTSPSISNNGLFTINPTAGGNFTFVRFNANATLSGTGSLVLNASPNLDTAYLYFNVAGSTLTQAAGHTIRGTGNVYVSLVNDGVVNADVAGRTLQLFSTGKTNNNIFTATNGGTLLISGIPIIQGANGRIIADGGQVRLQSDSITGGTIEAVNGGSFFIPPSNLTLSGVTNIIGPFPIDNNSSVFVTGGINHNDTITVNPTAGGNNTYIRFDNTSALTGASQIVLNANPGNLDTAYLYYSGANTVVTQNAGHTIRGTGNIYINLVNNSVVNADSPGRTLQLFSLPKTNNNLITATNGGALQISSIAVTQSAAGRIVNDASTLSLVAATINGGTVESINGAFTHIFGGTTTFNNVASLIGPASIDNNNSVFVTGGINHDSTITVNPTAGGNNTYIRFDNSASLSGPGTIFLNANPGNLDTAYLYLFGAPVITQDASHTIRGSGNVYVSVVNNGLVNADIAGRTLQLLSGSKTNNNLMTATNGGTLACASMILTQAPGASISAVNSNLSFTNTTVHNGVGASIAASNGAISLVSTTINGGSFEGTNGTLTTVLNGSSAFNNITHVGGPVNINNNASLFVAGGLDHNGVITVNPSAGGNQTYIRFDSSGSLAGPGQIVLNANPGNLDTAYLYFSGSPVITQDAGHVIRGNGNVYTSIINNGIIAADVSGRTLNLLSAAKTNNNLITATGGGVLSIANIVINQGPQGRIVNDASALVLNGATINGGTVESIHGSSTAISSGNATFNAVANVIGPVNIPNNQLLAVTGNLIHDDTITVNTSAGGNQTSIRFDSPSTLTGASTILLNANTANLDTSYINTNSGNSVVTNGIGHTIAGFGRIYGAFGPNQGIIAPGTPGGGTGHIRREGTYTATSTASHRFDLAGAAQGSTYDLFSVSGAVTLAGELRVQTVNGYIPPRGTVFTIITGASVTGTFTSVSLPTLPASIGYPRIEYTPTAVRIRIPLCPSDWNGRDGINSQDFFDFIADFFAGNADFNFDGFSNSQDFFDFLTSFFGGCG